MDDPAAPWLEAPPSISDLSSPLSPSGTTTGEGSLLKQTVWWGLGVQAPGPEPVFLEQSVGKSSIFGSNA